MTDGLINREARWKEKKKTGGQTGKADGEAGCVVFVVAELTRSRAKLLLMRPAGLLSKYRG